MSSKVLFVDDEGTVLKAISRALNTDYDITTAYSSEEALQLMASRRYAVVVTDMRMPGGDGLWLINQAVSAGCDAKFIVLTGNCDALTREAVISSGRVDQFLTKPCSIVKLKEAIDAAIESRTASLSQ
ncbi:MAG: response regulator [Planctomycetales bacterium]|nr:response regulator [Planctomycetales bacterium]